MGKKTRKTRACVAAAAGIALAAGAANANFVDGPEGFGDLVWLDSDMDGIQDAGEPGIPGINVNLLNGNTGVIIGNQITDASGNYLFLFNSDVLGIYSFKIEFELPVGYSFSPKNAGADNIDSDANPGTGLTDILYTSCFACIDYDVDAGMYSTVIPVPAAVWLFGSGLLGLFGVARRKKIHH